jgi:hypothetical protein
LKISGGIFVDTPTFRGTWLLAATGAVGEGAAGVGGGPGSVQPASHPKIDNSTIIVGIHFLPVRVLMWFFPFRWSVSRRVVDCA